MLGGRQLTKGNLEVVGIVERVEEILVEGMDVLEARETVQNGAEFLGKSLLSELDLSRIEGCPWISDWRSCKRVVEYSPRILLILKPARICVGSLR